jgi:hypothetical protein
MDGFGGGDNERAMIYVKDDPDRYTHANVPLEVIVSAEKRHEFAYTEKTESYMHELIHMDDGTTVTGKYFDGEWVSRADRTRHWNSDEVHSLTLDYRDFHIGIRGAKRKVTLEELLRIAGSFARP